MGSRGLHGRLPLSRITRLIAALYGAVTDGHAYFIVLKYLGCAGRVGLQLGGVGPSRAVVAAAAARKPELGRRVSAAIRELDGLGMRLAFV